MTLSVVGKYAIITGAGSGINLAFARLLLEKGCSVMIADLHLRPEAEQLLSEFPQRPGQPSASFHRTDVASWPHLSSLFSNARDAFPQIDIVVAGAGIFEPTWSSFWHPPKTTTNPVTDSRDPADADPGTYAVININVTHTIRLAQLAIGYWTTEKLPGDFLAVSSLAGHMAHIGTPVYIASKWAVHGFVRSLGALRDTVGIRSGAVAPGSVQTPMWTEDPQKKNMRGTEDNFLEPEEVASGMLELIENPELGDGTILEVLPRHKRVVPLYNSPPPSGDGLIVSGYQQYERDLFERLKGGMDV
ncbi:short chain dehydrogenase [Thozetella sp. PMI_491]|nr:short chain dehydrogenase [Thozetella sp. PMI_491]